MTAARCLAVLLAGVIVALAGRPPAARASYPGRAGEIVFQDSDSTWDPLSNGATSFTYALRAAIPAAAGTVTRVTCSGSDVGFVSGATQFCPESGDAFSPDGGTVAFAGVQYEPDGSADPDQSICIDGGPCPEEIILAGADGSGPRLLPVPIADAEHPAFMPDGELIFAGRTAPAATPNLYTVAADGSGLHQVTTDGGTDPAPCPNGTIVYVHRGDLYLLSASLRSRRRLTGRGGTLPDCSHDSRAIAFLRRSTLYTITAAGRRLRRLSTPGVADGRPAFSPAGGEIAFTATRRCTSHCGASFPQCTNLTDRLELINLLGRRRRSDVIGANACSSDGDLGGDHVGDTAWQPLVAGASP
jgi:Tol biopolymer transport system component